MEALIFDMDGLMIDTERLYFETEREMVARYGKEVPDEVLWRMMGRKPLESCTILVEEMELPVSPADFLRERDVIMLDKMRNDLVPLPGLFDIIDAFQGVLKMAIATGARKQFLDLVVDGLRIRDRFAVLQSSDEIKHGKPDPEIYLTAVRKLNVLPERSIVLEDSSNGSLAAKNAGCYTIAVPSEYTNRQNFDFVDYVAVDLKSAQNHIRNLLDETDL